MKPFSTVLAIATLVSLGASALAQSEGIRWRSDLGSAQAEAQQSGKLLLAHFWTETCGPCRVLEQRVFSQPPVALAIEQQYVPVKINANEAPQLAEKYGVTRVPTDAVLTADGRLVKAFVSPNTPMEYVTYVNGLATTYKAQTGGAFAAAAASAPAQPATGGRMKSQQTGLNAAYAQLVAQAPPKPAPQQPVPSVAQNPYAAAPPAATQTAVTPASVQAPVAVPLPPGSPPLGFEGYCTVTMKKENRWAKGDPRWGAIHDGRTYLFATQASQQAFLAKPDAFSPVLSGVDPVVAVDQRRSVPGVREFAVEYLGRFYMFSNAESLEKFWSDPGTYAQGAARVAALPAQASFVR